MSEKLRRMLTYVRVDKRTGKLTRHKSSEIRRECRIGRGPECDISIRNSDIPEPVHAHLVASVPNRPGITLINVCGRSLLLNNKPVATSAPVSSGDVITVSQRSFLYEEFQLVEPQKAQQDAAPPPAEAAAAAAVPAAEEPTAPTAASAVEESHSKVHERVDKELLNSRLDKPELERLVEPRRAYESEPPHVMDRREQQHHKAEQLEDDQDGVEEPQEPHERLGFNIDFPARRENSIFRVLAEESSKSYFTSSSSNNSNSSVKFQPAAATNQVQEPQNEEEIKQVKDEAEEDDDEKEEEEDEKEEEEDKQEEELEQEETGEVALFDKMRFVVGQCTDDEAVKRRVLEGGGRVSVLDRVPELAHPWDVAVPSMFYVTAPCRDGVVCTTAECLVCLAARLPVVDERWIRDSVASGKLLPFQQYLLDVEVPGAQEHDEPAQTVTQPLRCTLRKRATPLLRSKGKPVKLRLVAQNKTSAALQQLAWVIELCGGKAVTGDATEECFATLVVGRETCARGAPPKKRARTEALVAAAAAAAAQYHGRVLREEWLHATVLCNTLAPKSSFECPAAAATTSTATARTLAPAPTLSSATTRAAGGHEQYLAKMQFILHDSANTELVQRLIKEHGGSVVPSMARCPKPQMGAWEAPKMFLVTSERSVVGELSGLVVLCLALAIPVVSSRWLHECARKGRLVSVGKYLLAVRSERRGLVEQPIEFAKQDAVAQELLAVCEIPHVQLHLVGRDGCAISDTVSKSLLRNVEWLVGLMGGGVVQATRRHYLANVVVVDSRRDGSRSSDRFQSRYGRCGVGGESTVPSVTVQWLYESLLSNKLLPLADFAYARQTE